MFVTIFKNISPNLRRQVLAVLAPSLMVVCSGITMSVSGVLIPLLREDKDLDYDASYDSWIASSVILTTIFGSLAAGTLMDIFGRKLTFIILGIPYIIGWLFIGLASSTKYILIGRFISGFSTAATRSLSTVYLGEVLDPKYRSWALLLQSVLGNLGTLLSRVIGSYLPWRVTAFVIVAPCVIATVPIVFLIESPLWLISKGRFGEGADTFRWFRGSDTASEQELASVIEKQRLKGNISAKEIASIIFSRSFVKPFCILTLVMVNVQFCGVSAINFYAQDVFDNAFGETFDSFAILMTFDGLRLIMAVVVCFTSSKISTKYSFIGCDIITIISLTILIVYLALDITVSSWVSIVCLVVYIASSSALTSVGWPFVAEVLPNQLRGFGSGLLTSLGFAFLFVIVQVSPLIIRTHGEWALFAVFAVSSAACVSALVFILPHTNGRTLQSIEDSYHETSSRR